MIVPPIKPIFSFTLIILLIFPFKLCAQSGFNLWRNTSPPGQGNVISVDCDFRKGRIYAAEETEGLFLSLNKGRDWKKILDSAGLFNYSVTVKVSVKEEGVVYYAVQDALYRSDDYGKNWNEALEYKNGKIVSMDISPLSGKVFVADRKHITLVKGDSEETIFSVKERTRERIRSIHADFYIVSRLYIVFERGNTAVLSLKKGKWRREDIKSEQKINTIAPDPWTPGKIYAVAGNTILEKKDNEKEWHNRGIIKDLNNSPCLPSSFFISKRHKGFMLISYKGCGVYMSRDKGKNWWVVSAEKYFFSAFSDSLGGGEIISATSGDGIFIWDLKDSVWRKRNIIGGYIESFSRGAVENEEVFAVTYSGRVFKSPDCGNTWKEISQRGIRFFCAVSFLKGKKKYEIAIDAENYIFIREDGKNEWGKSGNAGVKILSLYGTKNGVYALTDKKIIYSSQGKEWTEVFSTDESKSIIDAKVIFPRKRKLMFICKNTIYVAGAGAIREKVVFTPSHFKLLSAVVSKDGTIYAVSRDEDVIYEKSGENAQWKKIADYPRDIIPSQLLIYKNKGVDFYILDEGGSLYQKPGNADNWYRIYENDYPLSTARLYGFNNGKRVVLFNDYEGILEKRRGYSFYLGIPGNGWRAKMVSFPFEADKPGKNIRLDKYISGRWQLYSAGKDGRYKKIKYVNSLKRDKGYWLLYSGNVRGKIPSNPPRNISCVVSVIGEGWNMVANPFPAKIRISQIKAKAKNGEAVTLLSRNNIVTSRGVWIWDGAKKKYVSHCKIRAGESFWIENVSGSNAKLIFNSVHDKRFKKRAIKNRRHRSKELFNSIPPQPRL